MNKFIKDKKVFVELLGALTAFYPIVNFVYNQVYKNKCEKFYGIPGEYFHTTINDILLYIGSLAIILFACMLPSYTKRMEMSEGIYTRERKIYVVLLTFIIGLETGFLNVLNFTEIMKQMYKTEGFFKMINDF